MVAKLLSIVILPLVQWFLQESVFYFAKAYEEYKVRMLKEEVAAKTHDALTNKDELKGNLSTEEAWKKL